MASDTFPADLPAHLRALQRHFIDLRDGRHGDNAVSREEKEHLFAEAVGFLDPYARQTLEEINESLLLATGTVTSPGLLRFANGDLNATWTLSWPEQLQRHLQPVTLEAFFGSSFHHPHLRGTTVGTWPLNIFSKEEAADELPILRAIAGADLHNLVFQSNFRIIPSITVDC